MALVGSLSGSGGASNTINVTGSMIIANPGTGGLFPDFPGTDSVFFVSGAIGGKTAGTRTVAVFGGDTVISGSLTIGTGSVTITSNDITFRSTIGGSGTAKIFSGSSGLTFQDSSGTRTLTQIIAGGGGTPGGSDTQVQFNDGGSFAGDADFIYNKTTHALSVANLSVTGSGVVSLTGDLKVGGNDIQASDGTVALTLSATSGDVAIGGDLTVTGNDIKASGGTTALTLNGANVTTAGNLTVTGDLTVNGTTTTIDTTNLLVEDPIILMASGAAGPNRNGGIAIFSGSADATALGARTELVFGRVASDTWGAGKINTNNGTSTDLTSMSLLPVRASKFEVGGTTAFVTSSLGTNILAQASTATTLKTTAGDVNLDAGTGAGVDILFNGTQAGAFTGTGATILNLFARDGIAGSTARSLVLSGSDVTIGAHSTVTNFSFAGTNSGLASSTSGFTLASAAGLDLNLSGSNGFRIRHGSSGVAFQQHGSPYLSIVSGSNALSTNLALVTGTPGKDAVFGGSSLAILSGSEVFLDAGANGVNIRRDSSTFLSFSSGSTNALTISTPISTTANLLNTTVTALNIGGVATTLTMGDATTATTTVRGGTLVGNTTTQAVFNTTATTVNAFGAATSINVGAANGTLTSNVSIVPGANNSYDLGTPTSRWRNMYTGDLHLRNERGDWTIIEEEEFLTITNNKNGKRYKFCLEEI